MCSGKRDGKEEVMQETAKRNNKKIGYVKLPWEIWVTDAVCVVRGYSMSERWQEMKWRIQESMEFMELFMEYSYAMLMNLIYIQNVGPHSMTPAPGSGAGMLRPPVMCSGVPEYHLVFLLASTLLDNRAQDDIGCLCTVTYEICRVHQSCSRNTREKIEVFKSKLLLIQSTKKTCTVRFLRNLPSLALHSFFKYPASYNSRFELLINWNSGNNQATDDQFNEHHEDQYYALG